MNKHSSSSWAFLITCSLLGMSSLSASPAVLPPKNPNVKKSKTANCDQCRIGNGWTLTGEFLYWQASENLSAFGQVVTKENILDTGVDSSGFPRGRNEMISYDWDPGFRVSAKWDLGYDCWDLLLDWTWYQNRTSDSKSSDTNSGSSTASGLAGTNNGLGVYATWLGEWIPANGSAALSDVPIKPLFAGPFSKAKVKWRLDYHAMDLEFGKSITTRSNLFRPFFGARGGIFSREARSTYTGYDNLGSLLTSSGTFSSAKFKTDMDFWGVGPLLGLLDEFRTCAGFRFSGLFAASLLYGPLDANEKFFLRETSSGSEVVARGSKFNDHRKWSPVTNLRMRFGIDWANCFSDGMKEFVIGAAWEQNIWFFHNYSSSINEGSMSISLGGAVAKMQLSF